MQVVGWGEAGQPLHLAARPEGSGHVKTFVGDEASVREQWPLVRAASKSTLASSEGIEPESALRLTSNMLQGCGAGDVRVACGGRCGGEIAHM